MAKVFEFALPDLGEGLTEAEIVRWMVSVGDVVAVDQPVVEVETAKAMVEVPCPYAGVVTARFGEEGSELPVGAPLLTVAVGASPEDVARDSAGERAAPGVNGTGSGGSSSGRTENGASASGERGGAAETSGNVLVGYGTGAAPARRRRVRPPGVGAAGTTTGSTRAAASAPPSAPVAPASAPAGSASAAPARDAEGPVPVISPLVRRLAKEHGLDLRELKGSGADGLILRADVEYAVRAAERAAEQETAREEASRTAAGQTRTPLRGVRGAVADKLSRSRREIPDATCWVDADATELMNARKTMNSNAAAGDKISVLALLARICTAALARYPELNATVDTEAREIVRLDAVHLGFAAQTERGLVVPVVRDAHARSAESLSAESARLTEAARTGTLTPAELTGGTFTLNNYGVFGVDGSTPIINHPEAAMLGVGRIVPKPWVYQGELAIRQVVQLSLTFDHRVCDGGTAGGFLRYVADCVEQPALLLRTL
ncbi:dihydrolipoamide acetyltransferase family protein [Streptomyces cavernicola]|uniref:Dihydrolipoamide acetyltransferase component of pyruvate dehydrogenase complex n=1 Tax=Streptomyces cavernicola TaxID=3043613 RepID=A0ABT6S405_9ACTN|nr:dihydrolipoamide acetyltransferase family protein [Streptomyces sp. B-S-A6]MDI3402820.1 dihydrolipoamide acetyltransferase family protein [Streptomyces sp. B-S-A6]